MKVKEIFVCILLFSLLCILCPHDQFVDDAKAWSDWSIYMLHNGYSQVYNCNTTDVNYNPFYLIVLNGFGHLMGSDDAIKGNVWVLKLFTLLVEWLGVLYLCYAISDKNNRLTNFLFCFLNIGFLYNTMLWGQIDGMLSAFIVCSIVALYRRQLILSVLLFVLAINTKLVAIFYLPVLGLLFLQQVRTISYRSMTIATASGVLLQLLIVLPFMLAGTLPQVLAVNFHAVGYYQYISIAAYNFWHLIFGGRLNKTTDTTVWGPMTYRQWGFLLFYISAFFSLLPVLKDTWRSWKDKSYGTHISSLLLCGGLICLSFFYFSTEMHERYSHVCLWFFAAYGFVKGRYLPFMLSSIAVLMNMAMACSDVFALQFKVIAVIYALAMLTAFIDLYRPPVNSPYTDKP